MVPPHRVVAIAGMPGSGKSLFAAVLSSLGFQIYSMGDVVRELARAQGIEPTPENLGKLMLSIRSEHGPQIIAAKTLEKIRTEENTNVCIEGLRSLEEVDFFRKEFPSLSVIGVHASPRTRFLRLTTRERRDDPKSREFFEERDRREIGVGLGGVLALADFVIVNEDSVSKLREAASRILDVVEIGVHAHR